MIFRELRPGITVAGEKIPAFFSDVLSPQNKYIYLIAGVHGDEVEGVYVLQKQQRN